MNNNLWVRCVRLAGVFLAVTAFAEEEPSRPLSFEAGVRYSLMTPSGDIGLVQDGDAKTTSLSDLGMDEAEGTWGWSLGLGFKRANLFLLGQESTYTGSGTTTHDISGDNGTIPAGAPVESTMDLGIYSAIGTYNLIDDDFQFGLGLGVMGLDFGVTYVSGPVTIPIDETILLPLLATSIAYDWTRWEVEGMVGGAAVNTGGNKVAYIDLDAAVRYVLYRSHRWGVQAALGYKFIAMDLELEEDSANAFEADLSFNGPYAGLRLLF